MGNFCGCDAKDKIDYNEINMLEDDDPNLTTAASDDKCKPFKDLDSQYASTDVTP